MTHTRFTKRLTIFTIITSFLALAMTCAGCGTEPLPGECVPGICPDGKAECTDAERLPPFCPGDPPQTTKPEVK